MPIDRSTTVLVLLMVLLVAGLGMTVVFWINLLGSDEEEKSPDVTSVFCEKFAPVPYEVSCQEAVEAALRSAPGTIIRVSIGPANKGVPGTLTVKPTEAWLIDIILTTPDTATFGREVRLIRSEVHFDGSGITKRPIFEER